MGRPPKNLWLIVIQRPDGSLVYQNYLRPHETRAIAEEVMQRYLPADDGEKWVVIKYAREPSPGLKQLNLPNVKGPKT